MDKIDSEKIARLSLEITARYKQIVNEFPHGNDLILKHLAAASIHMTLFIKDFYEILNNTHSKIDDEVKRFLNECGCDFNNENKN